MRLYTPTDDALPDDGLSLRIAFQPNFYDLDVPVDRLVSCARSILAADQVGVLFHVPYDV
jgi:hypothetical protein